MEIPYGKIAIYVLTFIGYIYSGYGSSILSNLRDAVISAEYTFNGLFATVTNVAKKFQTFTDVFDSAVEEDCIFKCPNATPKPNRHHQPQANGCGSLGLSIPAEYLPISEMTKCCNTHDICYSTCNKQKELCDLEFKRCLYRYCDGYTHTIGGISTEKACKGAAKMLYTGTLTFGCKPYLDSQKEACYCPPSYGWKDDKRRKYERGSDL
ncbi:group XIIA secretory phospholipase A2 isoform X2 [Coccinella septempunctata]|uniref:group XIIA secretory phospholipase A2 isoform X2 n=1 Tax=Coccinella septempunctata TaxID=41139 RepID=UPI001D084972|nr:group XIIA secretory phospholipase A2 isoform X2 [Coccinella septempunctata]